MKFHFRKKVYYTKSLLFVSHADPEMYKNIQNKNSKSPHPTVHGAPRKLVFRVEFSCSNFTDNYLGHTADIFSLSIMQDTEQFKEVWFGDYTFKHF